MNFDLKKPCAHCPFRNDIRPYLTAGRVEEIARNLSTGGTFLCHEMSHSLNPERQEKKLPEQHCAGALIVLDKHFDGPDGGPGLAVNGHLRIMGRLGALDIRKLDLDAPTYDDFDEMIEAQES